MEVEDDVVVDVVGVVIVVGLLVLVVVVVVVSVVVVAVVVVVVVVVLVVAVVVVVVLLVDVEVVEEVVVSNSLHWIQTAPVVGLLQIALNLFLQPLLHVNPSQLSTRIFPTKCGVQSMPVSQQLQ